MYFDMVGEVSGKNFATGDTVELKYIPRKWSQSSKLEGKIKNADGKTMFEISGSWHDSIKVKDLSSGETKEIWKEPPQIANANQQYFYSELTVLLNHLPEEVKQCRTDPNTPSLIAPTDTRFRGDQRLFEEGKIPEADVEKVRLEVKQRKRRTDLKEAEEEHKVLFFKEV